MKKIVVAWMAVAALMLGGCAGELQKIQTAWSMVTSASVSPTQIIVAANAFDAAEASATQYLIYCKANVAQSACALSIRKQIVTSVRAGRAARAQLEPYVTSGQAGPAAIYNSLIAAVTTLQSATPTQGASK